MTNAEAIKKAYIDPISSAVLVDEEFPAYRDLLDESAQARDKYAECDSALKLWKACHDRGWVCDVENTNFTDAETLKRADLVVLDFHLEGNGAPDLALGILEQLAEADDSRLVILYTKDPDLTDVRRRVAARLRGAEDPDRLREALSRSLDDLDERLDEISFQLDVEVIDDWLRGRKDSVDQRVKPQLPKSLRPHAVDVIRYLCEWQLVEQRRAAPTGVRRDVEFSNATCERHWLWCQNLFVVFVSKQEYQSDAVLAELHNALCDWAPTPIHLCLAFARAAIRRRGFEVERAVPRIPALETGLTYFALQEGPKRGTRVLFEKVWETLGHELGDEIADFGNHLLGDADGDALGRAKLLCRFESIDNAEIFQRLNTFLCSERPPQLYLRTGTVIELPSLDPKSDEQEIWICVTPLCELDPREPQKGSWNQLAGFRAVAFLRATSTSASSKVLKKLTKLKHILWDECGTTSCAEIKMRTETMLVTDKGRIEDGCVEFRRVVASTEGLELRRQSGRVCGQLRDQNASMLLQSVGVHVSRIGVDFVVE